MTSTGRAATAAACGMLALLGACDPCAGIPSCHGAPEVSFTGQTIEFRSGSPVAGVRLAFVRRSGAVLPGDTLRAVSASDGYFVLRTPAIGDGELAGDLTVTPPAPWPPYTVRDVRLFTSRARGDGGVLGRVVVNPYMLMVGELRERKGDGLIVGGRVTLKRVSGAKIEPDTVTFVTDADGRFFFQPEIIEFGDLVADFEIEAAGHPRTYLVRQTHQVQWQDGGLRFVLLHAGRALFYSAQALRRATFQHLPGTTVEFVRTGGIGVEPSRFSPPLNQYGGFGISPEPLADGQVVFDLIVRPPAPYPVEVNRDLRISTHDDDFTRYLGVFGYGAMAHVGATLRYRATGEPVDSGEAAVVRRVNGTPIETPLAADSGVRSILDGKLVYAGATTDTGRVTFDIELRLRPPARNEFIRGITVPSRLDTLPNDIGTFNVGLWYPQFLTVLDDSTGVPVAGAQVRFTRTSGAPLVAQIFVTQTGSDGTARISPIPRDTGTIVGTIAITQAAGFRDTTVTGVSLRATQDDTLRSIGTFRLRRTS